MQKSIFLFKVFLVSSIIVLFSYSMDIGMPKPDVGRQPKTAQGLLQNINAAFGRVFGTNEIFSPIEPGQHSELLQMWYTLLPGVKTFIQSKTSDKQTLEAYKEIENANIDLINAVRLIYNAAFRPGTQKVNLGIITSGVTQLRLIIDNINNLERKLEDALGVERKKFSFLQSKDKIEALNLLSQLAMFTAAAADQSIKRATEQLKLKNKLQVQAG